MTKLYHGLELLSEVLGVSEQLTEAYALYGEGVAQLNDDEIRQKDRSSQKKNPVGFGVVLSDSCRGIQ